MIPEQHIPGLGFVDFILETHLFTQTSPLNYSYSAIHSQFNYLFIHLIIHILINPLIHSTFKGTEQNETENYLGHGWCLCP